ncbi:MAG: FAD-dependent oxidoreductase [Pseudomonadota bacterium]
MDIVHKRRYRFLSIGDRTRLGKYRSKETPMAKASLVVVGGGYIGVELAQGLQETFDVTLVEPRDAFVHAPAMLRGLVDRSVRDEALIPYDKALSGAKLVKARATEIREKSVLTDQGEELPADYIVLCPGASNGGIFKPAGEGIDAFRAAQEKVEGQIKAADSIAIVGAGAVGTELAGEIAHAYAAKKITLISSDTTLFPGFSAKLGRGLAKKLGDMGVSLVLGQRVTDLKSTTEPYSGKLTLQNGDTLDADLVIPCIGSRPETALFESLPGVAKAADGRVKVDAHLRPSTYPNVFAAGDAVDAGDAMTIVAASRQQPWLAKLLKAVAAGKTVESQKAYTPWGSAPILVPLGPERGNSFLMIATFGDWVTKTAKGKDLFIGKYRKLLGYA